MVGEATPNALAIEQAVAMNLTVTADCDIPVNGNWSLLSPSGWQTIRGRALCRLRGTLASGPFKA